MRIEAGASGDSKDFLVFLQTNSYIKHLKIGPPKKCPKNERNYKIGLPSYMFFIHFPAAIF